MRSLPFEIAQDADQKLDRVAAAAMDVDTRMAALQPGEHNAEGPVPGGAFRQAAALYVHVETAGTAHVELSPFLGIEIEEQAPGQKIGLQSAGSPCRLPHPR